MESLADYAAPKPGVVETVEALRAQGNLLSGVPLPNGGWLRVETNCVDVPLPTEFPGYPNHRRILRCARPSGPAKAGWCW